MKRRNILFGAAGLVLLGAVAFWQLSDDVQPAERLVIEQNPVSQVLTATGRIAPRNSVDIKSQVSGMLLELTPEGSILSDGERLARIDDTDARNALAAAQSALEIAKANLRDIENNRRIAAQETLEQARIDLADQAELVENYETLYREGALDRKTFEQAQSAYEVRASRTDSAAAAYRSLAEGGSAYEAARLRVEQAAQSLERASLALSRHALESPVEGMVTQTYAQSGELIAPGQIVATVSSVDLPLAELDIDERNIGILEPGQSAQVWPDGYPSKRVSARVERIGSKVDPDAGTVAVTLALEENAPYLLQDLTVRAEIVVRDLEAAIRIPARFLTGENPAQVLVETGQGGDPQVRDLMVESLGVDEVLVLSGLEPDETILRFADGSQ